MFLTLALITTFCTALMAGFSAAKAMYPLSTLIIAAGMYIVYVLGILRGMQDLTETLKGQE